ncbi:hypothetical protein [Cellulomonas hominis]|uniref:hypothetical protein n=1 Tax=Cellulomonas hominis TaxID=156981 RepID=UPI001BA0078B|nr:hypothetical protein [Cellulomonas hominis]VTR77938.1 hypothetical protein CHMI_02714 [Cellulomonas hominis]
MLSAATETTFWSQSSPIWNLLSALLGGLIAAGAALITEQYRGKRERAQEHAIYVRDLYLETHLACRKLSIVVTGIVNALEDKPWAKPLDDYRGEFRDAMNEWQHQSRILVLFGAEEVVTPVVYFGVVASEVGRAVSVKEWGSALGSARQLGVAGHAVSNAIRETVGLRAFTEG